jgi:hypothetical protein
MIKLLDHPNCLKMMELYEGQNYIYCVTDAYTGGKYGIIKAICFRGF